MNRFTNYLSGQKMTKLHLSQAEQDLNDGKIERALRNTISAIREQSVAMNNFADLYFKGRAKR